MLRYKHFVGSGRDLELAINQWLAEYDPDITHMAQTAREGEVVISFLFDESFRAQELRLSEERGMSSAMTPAIPPDALPDEPITVPQEPGQIATEPG